MYIFPTRRAALLTAELITGLTHSGIAKHPIKTDIESLPGGEGYTVRVRGHYSDKDIIRAMAYGMESAVNITKG